MSSNGGQQVVLPLLLIVWLALAPAQSLAGFFVQMLAIGTSLFTLVLSAIWIMQPWWVAYIYLALWIAAAVWRTLGAWQVKSDFPQGAREWTAFALTFALGAWSANESVLALRGRTPPAGMHVVDLVFPLGAGDYLIANGGATENVNAHFLTLAPRTQRQAAYRGQSFGVDIVKLGRFGLRARGWRPSDPGEYEIFGTAVLAPCSGEVIKAEDGMPDMPVPVADSSKLEGNHVVLQCGDYLILLAHLRLGSVAVSIGDSVTTRQKLGEAGNSGQSNEPHLHVHAQRPAQTGPLLSGEPVHLTFDRRFVVRGDRLNVGRGTSSATSPDVLVGGGEK